MISIYFCQILVYQLSIFVPLLLTPLHEAQKINKVVCLEGGIITNPLKSMISTLLLLFPEIIIPTEKNLCNAMKKLASPYSNIDKKHPEVLKYMIKIVKVHNKKAIIALYWGNCTVATRPLCSNGTKTYVMTLFTIFRTDTTRI